MIWIVVIVVAALMFKLGSVYMLLALMMLGGKVIFLATILVAILLAILLAWRWYRSRRSS